MEDASLTRVKVTLDQSAAGTRQRSGSCMQKFGDILSISSWSNDFWKAIVKYQDIIQQLLVHDSVGEAVSRKVSGWVRLFGWRGPLNSLAPSLCQHTTHPSIYSLVVIVTSEQSGQLWYTSMRSVNTAATSTITALTVYLEILTR